MVKVEKKCHLKKRAAVTPNCKKEDPKRWCLCWHKDVENCNDDDHTLMTQWWWKRYCCHNNKATPVMKTDLHCSTLHQVCPHCAPIRASSHYSSLNQWVWRWKKSWKVPSLSSLHPKKQKSISSIGPCPMTGCLASFWCSAHTHTKISDTSLALFCWPFIAHAIWQMRRT